MYGKKSVVIFTMLFTTTYRFVMLVMIWLCHLATSLNINAGYYVNPLFQHPQNLRRTSVPQLIWSTYVSLGHNKITTWDRSLVDYQNHPMNPVVDNHNYMMIRGNRVVDNQNYDMTRENLVVDSKNHDMTRENPVVDNQNHMIHENPVVDNQNHTMTGENSVVDNQNHTITRENPVVDNQNHTMTRENPVVDNQNHTVTRETPVVDNQNQTMTRENPVVGKQNHTMTRENSAVVNQDQNLEDYSFKHIQPKCSLCPHQGTKALTHRGGDSIKFAQDSDVQQGGSDMKHVSGGEHGLVGNRTNDISAGSTNTLLPTVADPSKCVWAIISCCSPGSSNVRNPCFELLGCPGPFWDTNPCNEGITGAALKVVGEFYSNGKWE